MGILRSCCADAKIASSSYLDPSLLVDGWPTGPARVIYMIMRTVGMQPELLLISLGWWFFMDHDGENLILIGFFEARYQFFEYKFFEEPVGE